MISKILCFFGIHSFTEWRQQGTGKQCGPDGKPYATYWNYLTHCDRCGVPKAKKVIT
jgi:hypothetical protein